MCMGRLVVETTMLINGCWHPRKHVPPILRSVVIGAEAGLRCQLVNIGDRSAGMLRESSVTIHSHLSYAQSWDR